MKRDRMKGLVDEVQNCARCQLHETRKNPVPGDGSLDSGVVFIGEAPGKWEDEKGVPFVGRAGKILDELLGSIGLERRDVYITNILKCRPPDNRDPQNDEVKKCSSYLDRQIEIINPKIIATLGRFATSYIFEKFGLDERKISEVHGETFKVMTFAGQIKIIPLLHPVVATYNPSKKTTLLEDFKAIKKNLE